MAERASSTDAGTMSPFHHLRKFFITAWRRWVWTPAAPESSQDALVPSEGGLHRYGSVISTRPLPIDVERPGAWNRHFRKALHYWRYGYSHPDEDLLAVIDAVGDALNVQIAALLAVLSGEAAREAKGLKAELDAELRKKLPDFSVLLGIEARINALFPPEMARRRQWVIRERFQRVAAPEAYRAWVQYWNSSPPSDVGDEAADRLLAAAEEAVIAAQLKCDRAKAMLGRAEQEWEAAQKDGQDGETSAPPDESGPATAKSPEAERARAHDRLNQATQALDLAKRNAEEAKQGVERTQSEARKAELRCAVLRAKADVERKKAAVEHARAHLMGTVEGTPERNEAEAAFRAAEEKLEIAGHVLQMRVKKADDANATLSPDAAESLPATLTETQADSQTLLGYIHTSYLMSISREKTIRDLKRWLLMRFWWFLMRMVPLLLLVWLVLWWTNNGAYWALIFGLILIAAAGRAGATTSIIRRLQEAVSDRVLASDSVMELTALRTGKNEISLALLSSSIFALLMYALFISEVPQLLGMSNGIFPSISKVEERQRRAEAESKPPPTGGTDGGAGGPASNGQQPPAGDAGSASGAQQRPAVPSSADKEGAAAAATTTPLPVTQTGQPAVAAGPRAAPNEAMLERITPQTYAAYNLATQAVDAALSRYSDAENEKRALHPLNFPDRIPFNIRADAAVDDAVAAQRQVTLAAQRGRDQAMRLGNLAAIDAWEENREAAEDLLTHLEAWDAVLDARKGPVLSCGEEANCTPFDELATALGLSSPADFFKLLLWAFIAGFAERFVPDVLDRIVSQTRGSTANPAQPLLAAPQQAGSPAGTNRHAAPSPAPSPAMPGAP